MTALFQDIIERDASQIESVVLVIREQDWGQMSHDFLPWHHYIEVVLTDGLVANGLNGSYGFKNRVTSKDEEQIPRLYLILRCEDLAMVFDDVVQTSTYYVHVLPNEEIRRLQGLRLDSKVFTVTLDGEAAMISELYAIKGQPRYSANNCSFADICVLSLTPLNTMLCRRNVNIGRWSQGTGIRFFEDDMWVRRRDLSGVTLNTVIEHIEPTTQVILEDDFERVAEASGSHADIFELFRSVMRFNFSTSVPKDRAWGALLEDGSWSGEGQTDNSIE